jgi:hypothetical protein
MAIADCLKTVDSRLTGRLLLHIPSGAADQNEKSLQCLFGRPSRQLDPMQGKTDAESGR